MSLGQVLGPRSSSSPLIAQNEMFLYRPPKSGPGPVGPLKTHAPQAEFWVGLWPNPALSYTNSAYVNDFLKDSQNHGSPKYSIYVNSNRIKFMNCRIVLKCCFGGLYTYRQVLMYCFGYTKSCIV